MKTFKYSFIGRERGAIGVTHRINGTGSAASSDAAEFTLRNNYEVFHSFVLVEVEQTSLAVFDTLPDTMRAYIPNHLANEGSPALKAFNSNHIWVRSKRGNSYRHVFDSELNHLFSGSNDDLRAFYDCSPKTKYS